jgi:peptidyl-prolyl cis-trans isomerase C
MTSIRPRVGLAALALSLSTLCVPAMAKDLVVVNGKAIPEHRLEEVVQQFASQGRPDTPELRAMIREQLILRELFFQEAERKGLANSPQVIRQLDQIRQDVLIRALIQDHLANVSPVTDEEVRREYERQHGSTPGGEREYRARHILVDREDEAKQIIAALKKGERFENLARRSKDVGSAKQGGDLDWNTPDTFVKEFSDAMVKLDKGGITEQPVRTQFGFHVIRLDDVRAMPAPPMAQVGPQIREELERKRLETLQKALMDKAQIR